MSSIHFLKLMDDLKELHSRKSKDYAQTENPFSNFERAADLANWFTDPVDKIFASLIGIKLARLAELRKDNRAPQNESIADSFADLTCYAGLWTAYYRTVSDQKDFLLQPPTKLSSEEMSKLEELTEFSNTYTCKQCREKKPWPPPIVEPMRRWNFCSTQCAQLFNGSISDTSL
jgi:hypothetical protein